MKTKLLFLSTILFSFSINAQIDFEHHIIVEGHPDVSGPYTVISADIDGDGDKDIVSTSIFADKVVWLKNLDGQGNFSEPIVITSNMDYPLDISAADIDSDGDLDIVAVSTYDDKVAWFENTDGLGNFGSLNLVATHEYGLTVQTNDLDGDGDIDIIAGGSSNEMIWFENLNGLGTFGPEKIISNSIGSTEEIELSDIDGDGDIDVTLVDLHNEKIVWHENIDGQGIFGSEKVIVNDEYGSSTVVTKDIDGDGDLDVISVSTQNDIAWFENTDGLGDFGAPNIIAPDLTYILKIYSEDLDADGDNDVLASLYYRGEVIWMENDGNGNFGEPQIIYSDEFRPIGIIAEDFNGDSKMDVAAGIFESDQIIWFENRGPLSIEENQTNHFNLYPNPTNSLLNIQSKTSISEITIFNNIGQFLIARENKNYIDISTLNEGIYFVNIKDENGQTETKKVIKN